MSWFDDIAGLVKTAFSKTVTVGLAVVSDAASAIKLVMDKARELVDEVVKRLGKAFRAEPKSLCESLERELQEVNERIFLLRRKYQATGRLTKSEKDQYEYLRSRRSDINESIAGLDHVDQAEEMVERETDFEQVTITSDNLHILQYHVGQSTYNKICGVCKRPMVLQWARDVQTAGLRDIYWGCTGWYFGACKHTAPLSSRDLALFANIRRPEFDMKAPDLTRVTLEAEKIKGIREALRHIQGDQRKRKIGIATYRCPVHGESLVLQQKHKPKDELLDWYFLGCPRWLPDKTGCNFKVKLKSASQINSVLNTELKQGILQV